MGSVYQSRSAGAALLGPLLHQRWRPSDAACEQKESAESNQCDPWPNLPDPQVSGWIGRLEGVRGLVRRQALAAAQAMSPKRLISHVYETQQKQQRTQQYACHACL